MLVRKAAMFAVLTSFAFSSGIASAREGCWYPNEARAAQLLEFDSRLMSGVLRCRETNPSVVGHYDTFVDSQLENLRAHDSILKARFDRESGGGRRGGGRFAYEQYLASTEKQHSESRAEWNERDCARVVSLARVASQLPREELLMLAESIVEAPRGGACQPSRYSFGDDAAPGASAGTAVSQRKRWNSVNPATGERLATAASPQAGSELPPIGSRGPAAPLPLSAEPEIASAASATPATAVAPGATSGEFLQTAVAALQVAAAALQMAMSSEVEADVKTTPLPPEEPGGPPVALANATGELPEAP